MNKITENEIELFAIEFLEKSGYQYIYTSDIATASDTPARQTFEDVLLIECLKAAVVRRNPKIPIGEQQGVFKQIRGVVKMRKIRIGKQNE